MDNFHIYDNIGEGRASTVYRGRRKKTVEYVAIKSIDKRHMERVQNEVRVMHTLNHQNTLKFYNW